jgi:hypothetical protein
VPAITSGGPGGWRSRGNRDAMPNPVSQTALAAAPTRMFCRLDIFVDQADRVDIAHGRGDPDGEPQKASHLHRRAETLVERLAAGVFEHEQGSILFAHQFEWPRRPCIV